VDLEDTGFDWTLQSSCRNTKAGLADVVLEIACGLHNLRTDFRLAHSPAAIAAHIYFR